MTKRTLFLGDSHSHGYAEIDGEVKFWQEYNYGEIYSKLNNTPVAIYSIPGGCNKKYPTWLKAMLNYYENNISEIFIQATYWNRYLIACSRNLDVGDGIKPDHFTRGPKQPVAKDDPELVDRWTDELVSEEHAELIEQCRPENFEQFKGFEYSERRGMTHDWGPFQEKYQYTKLWHESATHLQYREWCADYLLMDFICAKLNIPMYVWSINDRVFIPQHKDFYGEFTTTRFAPISAEQFILKEHNINIETDTYRYDGEHYTTEIHEIIAKDYIDFVKNA